MLYCYTVIPIGLERHNIQGWTGISEGERVTRRVVRQKFSKYLAFNWMKACRAEHRMNKLGREAFQCQQMFIGTSITVDFELLSLA